MNTSSNRVMRTFTTAALGMLLAGLIPATYAADAGNFYVAPGIQYMDFDDGTNLKDEAGFSLGLGYDFTDRLSVEIAGFSLGAEGPGGTDVDFDQWRIDSLYDLDVKIWDLDTFIVGGFGKNIVENKAQNRDDTDGVWNFGAGVEYKFTDNISWRTAVRTFYATNRDKEDRDLGVDSSLVIRFGGNRAPAVAARTPAPASTPAPAAAPAAPDADGDGVPDSRDACPDTPRNYAVDDRGCPIPVEEVARVDLKVNFDFDRSEVKSEFLPEIKRVADFMIQYPDVVIELEGHTDSAGTEEYNQALSQRRTAAVRDVMINTYRVQATRVTATGYGESRPAASNDAAAGRAENRRVITVIVRTQQNYRPR